MEVEILKISIPLITFFLGVFSSPIVEHLKTKYQDKKLMKGMREEFKDEIYELADRIRNMASTLNNLECIKNGDAPRKGSLRYIPRETLMLFLEEALTSNYLIIQKNKRNTLKSISVQIGGINSLSKDLEKLQTSQETIDEIMKIKKKYLYTACCLRYSMQFYLGCKNTKHYKEISDKEMIENQFNEIEIKMSYDNIKVEKKIVFEY